jgi:Flp pilus assembly protein TadD
MDWLDRISLWAIVILVISSFALISGHMGEAGSDRAVQQRMVVPDDGAGRGEITDRLKVIRSLVEADNYSKAEVLIREMGQKYPYEGELHMLMGDLLMRKQDPVGATLEYKDAVDLNADYLDKKTPSFQGKKLKRAVAEAVSEIDRKIKASPGDESAIKNRKAIYYLQRRIAGSCS